MVSAPPACTQSRHSKKFLQTTIRYHFCASDDTTNCRLIDYCKAHGALQTQILIDVHKTKLFLLDLQRTRYGGTRRDKCGSKGRGPSEGLYLARVARVYKIYSGL